MVFKDGHLQVGPIVKVLFWFKAFMKHLAWLGWVEYVWYDVTKIHLILK